MMAEEQSCDICGQSGSLEMDADGLWFCAACRAKIISPPAGAELDPALPDELRALVGKNAGQICHVLNLPYQPPYQTVIDAAAEIGYDQDRMMSTWVFVTLLLADDTTVWRAPNGEMTALVGKDGTVRLL